METEREDDSGVKNGSRGAKEVKRRRRVQE